MNSQNVLRYALAAVCTVSMTAIAAEPTKSYRAPRTLDGQPDLQGVWSNATISPIERQANFGDRRTMTEQEAQAIEKQMENLVTESDKPSDLTKEHGKGDPGGYNTFWFNPANKVIRVNGELRTSVIVEPASGRVPAYTPAGEKRAADRRALFMNNRYAGPEVGALGERCIVGFGSVSGPPMLPVMYNSNYQIVQSKDHVVIMVEMVHDARIIKINGKHSPGNIRTWLGDSIGRWEGDTLVVETTNLRPEQGIQIGMFASYRSLVVSPNLKVVERFTRTADNALLYQFAIEDPDTFTQTWRGEMPWHAVPENIYEYACHEGNYALPGILAGAREDEKKKAAPAKP